jgi:hypothetical protein
VRTPLTPSLAGRGPQRALCARWGGGDPYDPRSAPAAHSLRSFASLRRRPAVASACVLLWLPFFGVPLCCSAACVLLCSSVLFCGLRSSVFFCVVLWLPFFCVPSVVLWLAFFRVPLCCSVASVLLCSSVLFCGFRSSVFLCVVLWLPFFCVPRVVLWLAFFRVPLCCSVAHFTRYWNTACRLSSGDVTSSIAPNSPVAAISVNRA